MISCLFLLSVLRVWDVILFEGNRAMLLRTALALMELYGTQIPFHFNLKLLFILYHEVITGDYYYY